MRRGRERWLSKYERGRGSGYDAVVGLRQVLRWRPLSTHGFAGFSFQFDKANALF
jgi:hypothetical protein